MKTKILLFSILVLSMYIIGCSENGCSCDEEEDCDCVESGVDSDGEPEYEYRCTGGDSCGCDSCDSDESRDGESCTPT
ncbi:MAG: hypothetical protein V1740_06030 [Candidatus Woesearchaeota archaeon]